MSDSETSSDVKVNIYDDKGKINNNKSDTKKSSDTDYYMNLLANDNKTLPNRKESSSESEIQNSESSSSKSTTSVKSSSSKKSNHSKKSEHAYSTYNNASSPKDKYKETKHSSPSNNNTSNNNTSNNTTSNNLTPLQLRVKKIDLLGKLSELKKKGFDLSREYDFNSHIEDMEYELDLLRNFVNKRNGMKLVKSGLLNVVSIIEFMNDKYDPFDFHLQGWGEHMSVEIDSYESVLEELYEKYKGAGQNMPPEVKLILLLIASAGAFHFSKTQASLPGLDTILKNNPNITACSLN